MDYFSRPEVSNSDLTKLKQELFPSEMHDPTGAYKFGTLIDMMITEPDKVNYFKCTCDGQQYSPEDFEKAKQMNRAFMSDPLAKQMLEYSEFQKIMVRESMEFDYDTPFSLPVRCKWDLWMPVAKFGGDIKSTVATSQKQFEDAAHFFDYDRQRYFYMRIAGSRKDVLIGISKVNFKVFKIPIEYGDDFWKSGREKTNFLAFKYWQLFAA